MQHSDSSRPLDTSRTEQRPRHTRPLDTSRAEQKDQNIEECIELMYYGTVEEYVTQAAKLFMEMDKRYITLYACGIAMSIAVETAEIIKRCFKGLHQITEIKDLEDGELERFPERREFNATFDDMLNDDAPEVPFGVMHANIKITLSKDALDTSAKGYQAPIDESLVKEEVLTEMIAKYRSSGPSKPPELPQWFTEFAGKRLQQLLADDYQSSESDEYESSYETDDDPEAPPPKHARVEPEAPPPKLTKEQIVHELQVLQTAAEQAADEIENLVYDREDEEVHADACLEVVEMGRDVAEALREARMDVELLTKEQMEKLTKGQEPLRDLQLAAELRGLQASADQVLQLAAETAKFLSDEAASKTAASLLGQ